MTVRRVIEDFDTAANNGDLPVECLDAVIWNLSLHLAPEYSKKTPPDVQQWASYSYNIMKSFYKNRDPIRLVPG